LLFALSHWFFGSKQQKIITSPRSVRLLLLNKRRRIKPSRFWFCFGSKNQYAGWLAGCFSTASGAFALSRHVTTD
jgi:hypothetical protein